VVLKYAWTALPKKRKENFKLVGKHRSTMYLRQRRLPQRGLNRKSGDEPFGGKSVLNKPPGHAGDLSPMDEKARTNQTLVILYYTTCLLRGADAAGSGAGAAGASWTSDVEAWPRTAANVTG
jgi:hypothetical protein